MDYSKLAGMIPVEKREMLSERLADFILTSKNDERMPVQLASTILHYWNHDLLKSQAGLTALLEAALLLEPDKTINAFGELQMTNVVEQIKEAGKS